MNMTIQGDPSTSAGRKGWTKLLPWAAALLVVVLVVWGVKVAWEKDEPQLPTLRMATPAAAPKPAPEPYLDVTAKVVDDETGKPVERFALQGGGKQEGKRVWGFWLMSPSNYPDGRLTHRFSGKIGEEQFMRIIADGYQPEPVVAVMGQPPIEDMVVRLSRGGTLRGKVVNFDGTPAVGAIYLAGAQPVSLRDGKPEYFGGSKVQTDEKGAFKLRGLLKDLAKEPATVCVVAQSVRPWPVEVKSTEDELEVKLPQPGKLRVKYDIEGAAAVGTLHLHIKSWEMPGWKGVDSMDRPKVNNGGEIVIDHLAPGKYDFARMVETGHSTHFCDRMTVIVESGKTAEAEFVRKEGAAVRGIVTGLDSTEKIETATARVRAAEVPKGEPEMFAPTFDAVALVDGKFKTSKLSPGNYVVHVDVFLPEPQTGGRERMGLRMPSYSGEKSVTVPASGEGPEIVVEIKRRKVEVPGSKAADRL
jgi:hypothetical protein